MPKTKRTQQKKKKKLFNKEIIFYIIYALAFLAMVMVGLLSKSFFAYEAFNGLFANIFYIAALLVLILTAMVHSVLNYKTNLEKIMAIAVCGGNALLLLLSAIVGGKIWTFVFLIYELLMSIFIAIVYTKKEPRRTEVDKKPILCVAILFIMIPMVSLLNYSFVNNIVFAWALIPTAVVGIGLVVAFFTFLRKNFFLLPKGERIAALILIPILTYMFFVVSLGTINGVFDGKPTVNSYTIVDKRITSGARQVTQFNVYVKIDGKKISIDVPVVIYHSLEIEDTLPVSYYHGALGFAYYKYDKLQ